MTLKAALRTSGAGLGSSGSIARLPLIFRSRYLIQGLAIFSSPALTLQVSS